MNALEIHVETVVPAITYPEPMPANALKAGQDSIAIQV